MKISFISSCLLAISIMFSNSGISKAASSPLANAVVLIIRHAEKPDSGPGLTPAGQRRAEAYVGYFEHFKIGSEPHTPDYLIATLDTASSERPRLTITPLSKALNIPIVAQYKKKDVSDLVTSLQANPTGKTILICWHHENIAAMLQAFGADPQTLLPNGDWPEGVYNWLIILRFDDKGNLMPAQCQRINEHLMPGD